MIRKRAVTVAIGVAMAAAGFLESTTASADSAQRTWSYLTTGNGHGFQVYDANKKKITHFLEAPYRYMRPRADAHSDGIGRRNLAFDIYFGLRTGTQGGWLNDAAVAEDPSYVDETNIIHAAYTQGGTRAEVYYFAPFGLEANVLVAILKAPGASDGYSLFNLHLGGGSPDSPDALNETLRGIGTGGLAETGPGGGAAVYVPLGPVTRADCQGVYAKVKAGQDLGTATGCSGNDVVPAFQRTLDEGGWMAVAVGFSADANGADALAKSITDWGAGRSPEKILADARAEWDAWRKPPSDAVALCTDKEKHLWRQSEAVLRMGQVRQPYGVSGLKNQGMMLASLPPGEWHTGWVRDGLYAVVALSRMGHFAEAKMALDFFLGAQPISKFKSFVSGQDYRISVVRYFGTGEEEADYSGQTTPNVEIDGWGLFMWAARAYVEASGDVAWLQGQSRLGDGVYDAILNGVAKPLEANLETNGIAKADSSIWEVHDANKKHFAYTTLAAARGFCDMGALAKKMGRGGEQTKYAQLSSRVRQGLFASFVDQKGTLAGSVEGISVDKYYDGAVAEAFTWNILPDFKGDMAKAILDMFGYLKVNSGGFKRNNDGQSSYDDNEWILVDFPISNALRRADRGNEADRYVAQIVDKASVNFNLLPELYNAVKDGGAIGNYAGSIPMVGYGGGAYVITMMDRSGIAEPNDCGDGKSLALPKLTCGGIDSRPPDQTGPGSSTGGPGATTGGPGAPGAPGATAGDVDGGLPGADAVPYGHRALLCALTLPIGAASGVSFAGLLVVPAVLVLRRSGRRRGRKS